MYFFTSVSTMCSKRDDSCKIKLKTMSENLVSSAKKSPFKRYKNDHWAIPTNPQLSFFGDKQLESHNKIYIIAFPAVYNTLSFLEAKEIATIFYPSSRGFAQIVQSLSAAWWSDRLFDTILANPRLL